MCIGEIQVHIVKHTVLYQGTICHLVYMVITELAIIQRAREREKTDQGIYSGHCVVNSPPYIMHTN